MKYTPKQSNTNTDTHRETISERKETEKPKNKMKQFKNLDIHKITFTR